jgi:hypothetical protein
MDRIVIEVDGELLDTLSEALYRQNERENPVRHNPDLIYLIVARVNGLSMKILANEHPPPHFHVAYSGEDASFSIVDGTRLPNIKGLERYDATIRHWWAENQKTLSRKVELVSPLRLSSGTN